MSAGGATRLLRARDGWCALTLSRPDDIDAVPALVGGRDGRGADDPWPALESWAAGRRPPVEVVAARPAARPARRRARRDAACATRWCARSGAATPPRAPAGLLVVDMSSMWAGPLCGQLLARAGATVVKVESRGAPRRHPVGSACLLRLDERRKALLCSRFRRSRRDCGALLAAADVVIEASRPAALARRGLGPTDVAARDGRVWLRITGHGAEGERANWVAFGDDAAVAGGLVGGDGGDPVFCGDAIADPLTGLDAALAVAESLRRGGGELIEIVDGRGRRDLRRAAALPGAVVRAATAVSAPSPPAAASVPTTSCVDRLIDERGLAPC